MPTTDRPDPEPDPEPDPGESQQHSVTRHLAGLKAGDPAAADAVMNAYFARVVRAAERRLGGRQRVTGGEDVAASVFESLWERAAGGGFDADDLSDRDDLWRLLCHMLRRKVTDHRRKDFTAKRGGGAVRGESVFGTRDGENVAGLDALAETAFTPDELAEFAERHEQLMAALGDDVLAEVATLRLEGYEVTEIAARLGVSARTVKRKLALIRETWREVGDLPPDP